MLIIVHRSVCFKLSHPKPDKLTRYSSGRDFRCLDRQEYADDLADALRPLAAVGDGANPDDLLRRYTDAVEHTLDKHAPNVTRKRQHKKKCPWYDETVHGMRQKKRQLERQWRRTGLEVHREMYITQRSSLNSYINRAKAAYYNDLLTTADQKTTFRVLDSLLKVKHVPLPESDSIQELTDNFASFFAQKIEKIVDKIEATVANEHLTEPALTPPVVPVMDQLLPTNARELKQIIMKGPSKTCILDSSPTDLLKGSLDSHLPTLVQIVNSSLSSGRFPTYLKTAVVTPLLKKTIT